MNLGDEIKYPTMKCGNDVSVWSREQLPNGNDLWSCSMTQVKTIIV